MCKVAAEERAGAGRERECSPAESAATLWRARLVAATRARVVPATEFCKVNSAGSALSRVTLYVSTLRTVHKYSFYTAAAAADLRPVAVSCRAWRRPQCSVSALHHIMKAGIRPAKFCELHQLRRYVSTPGVAHCPVSNDFAGFRFSRPSSEVADIIHT